MRAEDFLNGATAPAVPSAEEFLGQPESSSMLRRGIADPAISLLKGAIAVPEAAVGLANIPTMGLAGKFAEGIGFRPKDARAELDTWYSPEQQSANKRVQDAKGFFPTVQAAVENPSVIGHTVAESVPSMMGGAAIARGLLGAGGGALARSVGATAAPTIAGAAGEGIVGAGLASEQIRQQTPTGTLTPEQLGYIGASGIGTALIGAAGGSAARKMGLSDVDTMLAGGVGTAGTRGMPARVLGGAASEGMLEEMPQSAQEQAWQNLALNKPVAEGVPEQAAIGLLSGAVMGGAGGIVPTRQAQPLPGPLQKAADAAATTPLTIPQEEGQGIPQEEGVPPATIQAGTIPQTQQPAAGIAAAVQNTPAAPGTPFVPVSTAAPPPTTTQAEPAGVPISQPQEGADPRGNETQIAQPAEPGQQAQPAQAADSAAAEQEWRDFVATEGRDIGPRQLAVILGQFMARRRQASGIEAATGRVENARQREVAANRMAVLESLPLTTTGNTIRRFAAALRNAGIRDYRVSPEERRMIARRIDARDTLQPIDQAPANELTLPEKREAKAIAPTVPRMDALRRKMATPGARIVGNRLLDRHGKRLDTLSADEVQDLAPKKRQAPKKTVAADELDAFIKEEAANLGNRRSMLLSLQAIRKQKQSEADRADLDALIEAERADLIERRARLQDAHAAAREKKPFVVPPLRTPEQQTTASNAASLAVPPIVKEMIGAASDSAKELRDRISGVKFGPIVDGVETIKFALDGKSYVAKMVGRNRDFVLSGKDSESDRGYALRALADGQATPENVEPQKPKNDDKENRRPRLEEALAKRKAARLAEKPQQQPSPADDNAQDKMADEFESVARSESISPSDLWSAIFQRDSGAENVDIYSLMIADIQVSLLGARAKPLAEAWATRDAKRRKEAEQKIPLVKDSGLRVGDVVEYEAAHLGISKSSGTVLETKPDGSVTLSTKDGKRMLRGDVRVEFSPVASRQTPPDAPQQPLSSAGDQQSVARMQSAYNEAKAKLDAIGPEPRKPSSERQAFGANGKAGAPADVVAKYEASVKAYVSWRAKYNRLKKTEVEASNALFAAKKKMSQEMSPDISPDIPRDNSDWIGASVTFLSPSGRQKRGSVIRVANGKATVVSAIGQNVVDLSLLKRTKGESTPLKGYPASDTSPGHVKSIEYARNELAHGTPHWYVANALADDVLGDNSKLSSAAFAYVLDADNQKLWNLIDSVARLLGQRSSNNGDVRRATAEYVAGRGVVEPESEIQKPPAQDVNALKAREAAKKAEADKAAEEFALGQAAPEPVVKKVTTEEARGQEDLRFSFAGQQSAADGSLYNVERAPFYSQLSRAIEQAPAKIFGGAAQLRLWLHGNTPRLGIKKDEVFWSGIDDWLALRGKEKTSKADVLAYLDQSGVKVQDVVLSSAAKPVWQDWARLMRDRGESASNSEDVAKRAVSGDESAIQEAYEIGVTEDDVKESIISDDDAKHAGGELVIPGGTDQREMILTVPGIDPWGEGDTTHYGDTGEGRTIGWLRMNTREDAKGRRVLFIEEVQSKRGQEGRRSGFGAISADPNTGEFASTHPWRVGKEVFSSEANARSRAREISKKMVPPAPFVADANHRATNAYITLLMKKAIAYAAETGHDAVAWTTGEQQSERYDLSSQVDAIRLDGDFDRSIEVHAARQGGLFERIASTTKDGLANIVGSDIAKKAIENGQREFSGLDLKIGGEWANAMYGDARGMNADGRPSLIAQALSEIGKQFGRMPVESVDIGNIGSQPSIAITDAMRARVLGEGFPLFNRDAVHLAASPSDRAVYEMAAEGKSAQEILSFLSKASRRPFNRVLANALSRIGVSSNVSVDQNAGWLNAQNRQGARFAASYSPKTDTVSLFTPRNAEIHALHEFVHASSMKAIARGGLAARQMQAIFDYVQKTGTMSDQYGMGNFSRFPNETDAQFKKRALDEFVAELFTNPQFQVRLKQLPAPSGSKLKSAWDWVVRVIANLLGMRTNALETALDRALSVGAALLQENADLTMPKGETARYHTTWHGSPHKFYTFDLSKIGTGEGAQAYGHGLYVAEAPDVALQYSNMRAAPNMEFYAGKRKLTGLEKSVADDMTANGKVVARINAKANGQEWLAAYERIANELVTRGIVYKVDLPAEAIARMLDWDKPFSKQAPEVKSAFKKYGMGGTRAWNEITGMNLYIQLGKRNDPENISKSASELLLKEGVPGIKYLDEKSRDAGKGTSNFVLFDDKLARIIEVNGVETGVQPWQPGEWEAAQSGERFSQEQPFDGRETATTPLKHGSTTLMVDGTERPALNSNGKPIHWSEEGVKNFWRWFSGSRVIDEQGRPLVVYHGSDHEITEFEPGRRDPGVWFTTRLQTAAGYAKGDSPAIHFAYLKSEDPFIADFSGWPGNGTVELDGIEFEDNVSIVEHAQRVLKDGVEFPVGNFSEDDVTWVVFGARQIKSATDNTGAFSEDPDIRYSAAQGGDLDYTGDNELPAKPPAAQTIDRTRLRALRYFAAGLERPREGIFLFITEDGRAIASGPKGARIPESFRRYAREHGLTFQAQRKGYANPKDKPVSVQYSGISGASEPMPSFYREDGALYFGEMGEQEGFDRTDNIRFSAAGNWQQSPIAPGNLYQAAKKKAASLLTPERLDKVIYEMQDKFIDLRRIRDHIKEIGGAITDMNDAYLGEELYHKRLAHRTEQFLKEELQPFFADMKARGVTMPEFEKFLHARHAPEANAEMAKRNPNQKQIDAGRQKSAATVRLLELKLQTAKARGLATVAIEKALNDARDELVRWNGTQAFRGTEEERLSLSGMSNTAAGALISSMTPDQRADMNALAAKVDAINEGTLQALERYGLMDKAALNTWRNTYQHYVPLHRDEAHPDSASHPIGQGFNVRGDASKRRTGSNQEVTNIFGHIAMQREAALTRGEKNRVMQKLYLMARQNPSADIWSVGKVPMIDTIDKATGFVRSVPDPQYKDKPNVVTLRIGGKDVAIVMNEYNPQALRMARSIKNLDVDDLHYLIPVVGKATRWFASINTQYNPIFGLINFARDVQAAALNLSTTEISGKQKEVFQDTMSILGDIIKNKGRMPTSGKWAPIYKEFNEVGGTTGYRDLFLTAEDRSKAVTDEIKALDRGRVSQAAHAVASWLSDYNEAMENATRLAAYKAAIDNGMSKERAASLAKNLTVNFNRKGRQTRELGALYAFFNAAVQGTTRMAQTLSGPAGKKILLGGVLAGAASAMAGIAAMGGADGEDDEWSKIPEFVKERSFIIPAGKDKYIAIPMPLGFHFLPNIGRLMVEWAVYKDKTAGKQMASLFTVLADAFNPLGGSAPPMQIIAPTVMDPFVALAQNKDWTGKPIYVENFNSLNPQPGAERAKDSATPIAKGMADAINAVTGGTKYVPGAWSPTPDQIDYVIGQLTGGVGRELGKLSSTIAAPFTGDELPAHKIPLLGRLYGSTSGASGQAEKFYANIKRSNEAENEIKGRRKDGISVDVYLQDNPKAVELAARGNAAERQIRALRQMRSRIVEAGGDDATSKARQINERMATVMRSFNMQVERMQ